MISRTQKRSSRLNRKYWNRWILSWIPHALKLLPWWPCCYYKIACWLVLNSRPKAGYRQKVQFWWKEPYRELVQWDRTFSWGRSAIEPLTCSLWRRLFSALKALLLAWIRILRLRWVLVETAAKVIEARIIRGLQAIADCRLELSFFSHLWWTWADEDHCGPKEIPSFSKQSYPARSLAQIWVLRDGSFPKIIFAKRWSLMSYSFWRTLCGFCFPGCCWYRCTPN